MEKDTEMYFQAYGQSAPTDLTKDVYGRPLPKYEGLKSVGIAVGVMGLLYVAGQKVPAGRGISFASSDGGRVTFFGEPTAPRPKGSLSAGNWIGLFMAATGGAIIVWGVSKSEKMKASEKAAP